MINVAVINSVQRCNDKINFINSAYLLYTLHHQAGSGHFPCLYRAHSFFFPMNFEITGMCPARSRMEIRAQSHSDVDGNILHVGILIAYISWTYFIKTIES